MTTYGEDAAYIPPIPVIVDRQRTLQATVTNILSRLRATEDKARDNAAEIGTLREDVARLTRAVERGNRIMIGLLVSAVLGSTSITVAILLSTKGVHP